MNLREKLRLLLLQHKYEERYPWHFEKNSPRQEVSFDLGLRKFKLYVREYPAKEGWYEESRRLTRKEFQSLEKRIAYI